MISEKLRQLRTFIIRKEITLLDEPISPGNHPDCSVAEEELRTDMNRKRSHKYGQ